MTVIIGFSGEDFIIISADRRRSDFDEHNEFKEVKDDWVKKIENVSGSIVLAAAGEVETTNLAKERLKKTLAENSSISTDDLFARAQEIFRDAIKEIKENHLKKLNKGKCFFQKKIKFGDITNVNAAYILAGIDNTSDQLFLAYFSNLNDYKVSQLQKNGFVPLGNGMDLIHQYFSEHEIESIETGLEDAIKLVAKEYPNTVNTNVFHCRIDIKSGVKFTENPKHKS
jgi:20S proteasome alpha/beta subunit